jgi:hypothetical protein
MEQLAKAVIAVMKEVKGVEKNTTVGTGNFAYKGVSDKDVKEVFNKALVKNGLCILPIGIEEETQIDRWEAEEYGKPKQKQSVFTKVKTRYLLLHESGESQELAGYGHGVDAQDKGAGKATTYALKYALLYTFLTPVGAISDADTTHSDEVPQAPAAAPAKKALAAKPKLTTERYEKALTCGAEDITKALTIYDLTEDQIHGLNKAILNNDN